MPKPSPSENEFPNLAPPSTSHIRSLALGAVEAVQGLRATEQLGRWVTANVLFSLQAQRQRTRERDTVYRDRRREVVRPGRMNTSTPCCGVLEAAIVMHTDYRSFAVVMRFESVRNEWRATELSVM